MNTPLRPFAVALVWSTLGLATAPILASTFSYLPHSHANGHPDGAEQPIPVRAPAGMAVSQVVALGASALVVGIDQESEQLALALVGPDKALVQLPSPTSSANPQDPVAIVSGDALVALAWRAGDSHRAAIQAARWTGESWRPTVTVAAPGPGSQLALRGAVTADGRVVVAWSRFDGEDDEIMWSRLEADGWSAPRRIGEDNEIPDITPALGLVAGELHLAWSQWDGDTYRIRLARLDGNRWVPVTTLPGRGAFAPRFEADAVLSYRDGERRQWVARELTTDGASRAESLYSGTLPTPDARPQLLVGRDGSFWAVDGAVTPIEWDIQPIERDIQ